MGQPDNRQGHEARRWQAALAACAVACLCAPAQAQRSPAKAAAPRADPPVRAAAGVLVQYEEKRDTHIVYFDEKGGMLTAPPAIVGEARGPAAGAAPPTAKATAAALAKR